MLAFAVLFGAPAIFVVERGIEPAGWLIRTQDRAFGGHFSVATVALVLGLELLVVAAALTAVALLVRVITGRTVAQLVGPAFRRR